MMDDTTISDVLSHIEREMSELEYCAKVAINKKRNEKVAIFKAKYEELDRQRECIHNAYCSFIKHMESVSKDICDN